MRTGIRLRITPRRRHMEISLLFSLLGVIIFAIIQLSNTKSALAVANGDFRSITSGNWNNITTWEKYSGGTWIAATVVPNSTDGTVTILSGHTVTITAALTADQIVVESGAVLVLNPGIILSLRKSAIPDLRVYGTFRNAGTVTITAGTNITYESGGVYQHNYTTTAGTIPVGVWNSGSTCEIIGYTTNITMPAGLNQAFDVLKWNCTSQAANINFAGGMNSFTGTFMVASTGSNELQLSSTNVTLALTGNYSQTGGIFTVINGASKTGTLNISGNVNITGGTFNLTNANNAIGIINIIGNWAHTGGTIAVVGIGHIGTVNFTNAGNQTFTASGNTITGNLDFNIASGSILNTGMSAMTGRNLTIAAGGEIGLGSPDGISSSGTSTGNIQVTGTRTYTSGCFFLFNGTGNQITGTGFPSSVHTLIINNNNYVTLTNNVAVSNTLNFQSGKFLTGTKELQLTNTAAGAIVGNLNSSYVIGNFRRTISNNGTFLFPLGSYWNYEEMNVTTAGVAGTTTMLGSFVNANVNDTAYPLNLAINGLDMLEVLDHGYWTLVPNISLSAGTFTVQLKEKGFTNILSSTLFYSLVSRANSSSSWQSIGTHNNATQSESGGVVTAARSGMNAFYQYGIALGDAPNFASATLISGTDGQVGAIYKFPNVMRNTDAWMEITSLYNGATLSDIDNDATGYTESFQPFVNFPPETDSYIEWKVKFKKAGTSTDTTLSKITATGVDVDGSYSSASDYIREYVVATMPTSYSLDVATTITMSSDSGRYKALSGTTTISSIDTSHHEAMYQLNYNNVNTLLYRTGANNQMSSSQTRQTSLFFKSFLTGSPTFALPIKLIEFNAKPKDDRVFLNWRTASEINNDYFTIERSSDGENFNTVFTKRGAGNSTSEKSYEMIDENPLTGISYYRLKQTDYDGKFSYSEIKSINLKSSEADGKISIQSISPNPFSSELKINFSVKSKGRAKALLLNDESKVVLKESLDVSEGNNSAIVFQNSSIMPGIYFVIVEFQGEKVTRKVVKE